MPAPTLNEIDRFAWLFAKHNRQRVTFSNYDGSDLLICRLGLAMTLHWPVGELICRVIGKAEELSNFRLRKNLRLSQECASSDVPPRAGCPLGESRNKIVRRRPWCRTPGSRLDGKAPRRSFDWRGAMLHWKTYFLGWAGAGFGVWLKLIC